MNILGYLVYISPLIMTLENEATRILAVDDDLEVLHFLAAVLKRAKYQVETANDPHSGLERFKQGSFDLVITDRQMPGLTGDELARSIKLHRAGTPVLMVTGTGRQIRESGGKLEGVDMVIGKPVGPKQLLEAVESLLSRSRDPGR